MSFNLAFFSQSKSNQRIKELEDANQVAESEIQVLKELNKTLKSRLTVLENFVAVLEQKLDISTVTVSNPSRVLYNTQAEQRSIDVATSSNTNDFLAVTGISTIVSLAETLPSNNSTMADTSTFSSSSSSWSSSSSDSSTSACSDGSCGCE